MSQTPPPGSDRPTRSIPEAINELIASVERLQAKWQGEHQVLTVDLQRTGQVLTHLQRAAAASRGELPTRDKAAAARRNYVTCPDCNRRGSAKRASRRCATCAARAGE